MVLFSLLSAVCTYEQEITENGVQGHTLERSYASQNKAFRRRKRMGCMFLLPVMENEFESVTNWTERNN